MTPDPICDFALTAVFRLWYTTTQEEISMKPKYLLGFALIAAAIVFLIVTSMSANAQYFYTVEELRAKGQGVIDQNVRISGSVINSSTKFEVRDNQPYLEFAIADAEK